MENMISNFGDDLNIVIIGATGGIGAAFVDELSTHENVKNIFVLSRKKPQNLPTQIKWLPIDIVDEASIRNAVENMGTMKLDIVINATGILSVGEKSPERSLRDINFNNFEKVFAVNTHAPAMLMKNFLPMLNKERKSVFVNLSARVGSITDNQLGGWYAYRASKAALNMLIKTASIEIARTNKNAIVMGLHPGTVDTNLSKPFKANVPEGKLFTPEFSISSMLKVINNIQINDTGLCLDWQGEVIQP